MCDPRGVELRSRRLYRLRLLALLAAAAPFLSGVSPCPLACQCLDEWQVECRDANLTCVPREIPPLTRRLAVTGNSIPILGEAAVAGNGAALALLHTLDLRGNRIQTIAPSAFRGLPSLKTLNLSENALGSIARDAFLGLFQLETLGMNRALQDLPGRQLWPALDPGYLPNLTHLHLARNHLSDLPDDLSTNTKWETLDLTGNQLPGVGEGTIARLEDQAIVKVYLSSNPLRCDCGLRAMYQWLKNSSQVGDVQELTCAHPESLNGTLLGQLTPEDLRCPETDAASYVFLGIVLALIGATFLMVLYLNRKGIKRWASNFREACRDQMEGYEYRAPAIHQLHVHHLGPTLLSQQESYKQAKKVSLGAKVRLISHGRQFIEENENSGLKPPLPRGHTHSWGRLREQTLRETLELESLRQPYIEFNAD